MKKLKPLYQQAAFTLLELLLVVVIVSILAAYIGSKFLSSRDFNQDSVIQQIIASARLAQQLSMNDSSRSFTLIIQANQIDLQANGVSMQLGNINYPLDFGSQITLSPVVNITFNSLGETTSQIINVQANTSEQICLESSGYIHEC